MQKIDGLFAGIATFVLLSGAPTIAGLDGDAGDAIEQRTGYRTLKQAAAAARAEAERESAAASAAREARANVVRTWERAASVSGYQTRVATAGSFANGLQNVLSGWAIEGATKAHLYRLSGAISEGITRSGARGYLLRINVYRNASNATLPTPNLLELIGPANTPEVAYAVGALGPTYRQAGPSWAWLDKSLSGYLWIVREANGQYKLFPYTGGWATILEGRYPSAEGRLVGRVKARS